MIYVLFGLVFGIVGGMGLGGGIVLIPALTMLMNVEQHAAQGMTLFAYLPMATFALLWYIRRRAVRLRPVLFITAFGLIGAVGGYLLATVIDTRTLRIVFGAFLIAAALLRFWRQEAEPRLKKRREEKDKQ